jgi:Zn-dependent peptidase ImmA (M78 family)/DNA-binding XRE family transcriptional regulator
MTVGERLREGRERAALTQGQVARVIGVPRELVSMWEGEARTPNLKQLERLARIYQIGVDYLLGKAELEEKHERDVLYQGLPQDPALREEIDRWLDFLDEWADLLEELGEEEKLTGPGKPPRKLDKGQVTDSRRASTLAIEARDYYGLGRDAIPNLYAFLDSKDVLVYRASLGSIGEGSDGSSGAFFNHPRLGYCILVNADTTPGRQVFTLAHEFAHALYHYPSGGIICRKDIGYDPKERFANSFAAHFLVPAKELRKLVEDRREIAGHLDAYEALQIAAHFRVSYATLLYRLREENLIDKDHYESLKMYSPSSMAAYLDLDPEEFEIPEPKPLYLERYPVSVIERIVQAIEDDELTMPQAADVLDIDPYTLQQQVKLILKPPKAKPQERREFEELPF